MPLNIITVILCIAAKLLTNELKRSRKKPIDCRVNGKAIKTNWQHGHYHLEYYHQLLKIPKKTLYMSDRVIEDYYRLSLSPDKGITPAAVADKQAARQYLLARIHYMHSLN